MMRLYFDSFLSVNHILSLFYYFVSNLINGCWNWLFSLKILGSGAPRFQDGRVIASRAWKQLSPYETHWTPYQRKGTVSCYYLPNIVFVKVATRTPWYLFYILKLGKLEKEFGQAQQVNASLVEQAAKRKEQRRQEQLARSEPYNPWGQGYGNRGFG